MNPIGLSREAGVARSSGTALHRQVFVVLRDEIARGMDAGSGALPSEEGLCARFGVSRITIAAMRRRALYAIMQHLGMQFGRVIRPAE